LDGSSGSGDAAERSKCVDRRLRGAPRAPSRASGAAFLTSEGLVGELSEQRAGAWSSSDEKVRIIEFHK